MVQNYIVQSRAGGYKFPQADKSVFQQLQPEVLDNLVTNLATFNEKISYLSSSQLVDKQTL